MPTENFDVLIVGAGVSGIGMACTLTQQCPDQTYAILETRGSLGGTWDLFRFPGVRSDSDMFTYGYAFRPWHDFKVLADGATIRQYIADTAREFGVDRHIRYFLKTTNADWHAASQRWIVTTTDQRNGVVERHSCRHLVMSTGYFNYDAGYTPALPELEKFTGQVVHPQDWPASLDWSDKRVVVLDSGATAITLLPAMAQTAAHVTMLQRSPTYIMSLPSRDGMTRALSRILPKRWAFAFARRRNTVLAGWIYQASRKWPARMRKLFLAQAEKHLAGSADMAHFTPSYQPWDQRVCVVPDANLFTSIKSGKASVVTDEIAGFSGGSVLLRSGRRLDADILVTATGLDVQALGGMQITVDGQAYDPNQHMFYKAVLLENLPNFYWIFGYTNASWTLKVDLATRYICRVIKHMKAHGKGVAVARDNTESRLPESIMGSLNSGYITRAAALMPRQGSRAPWKVTHHYATDKTVLLQDPIADDVLRFEDHNEPPVSSAGVPLDRPAKHPA
jgi:monooxygenase